MNRLHHLLFVRHRHNWVLFLKFALVGGSGVLVNMLVAVIMHRLHGGTGNSEDVVVPLWSDYAFRYTHLVWIVAFLVANLTNFQLNRSWTFQSGKHAQWWREFWPFLVVGSVAAAAGLILKDLMTNPASPLVLPEPWFLSGQDVEGLRSREYWAQLVAVFLTMPINFLVNKFWTFAAVRNREIDEPMLAAVVAPELVDDTEEHLGEIRADEQRGAHESLDAHEAKG